MKIAREETFGPVAPLFRFSTEDQAVAMSNDTPFGLASYLFTRDISRAFRVAEALEFGMVESILARSRQLRRRSEASKGPVSAARALTMALKNSLS